MDAKGFLKTLTALAKCECLSDEIISLLGLKLEILLGETWLQNQDNEKEVYDKMHCRIAACELSAELYRKKFEIPAVLKWKSVSESTDEFIEIRSRFTVSNYSETW